MPAYTLRADNPKMVKADPSKRTRCLKGCHPAARPPPVLRNSADR